MTGLWADVSDLEKPTSPNALEALQTASYLIWVLSGRRWSGWHTVTEEYVCDGFMTRCGQWIPTTQQWEVAEQHFITTSGDPYWGHRPGQHFLFLRRRPARELLAVQRMDTNVMLDLTTLAIYDYAYLASADLNAECTSCWDPCGLEVTYKWGGPPPPAGVTAVLELANEFVKSIECPDECRLPERVTSVTRQGISYQIFDPQDFMTDGRVGLYAVDVFLKAVNPNRAQLPARVFSPDLPVARQRTWPIHTATPYRRRR
jgi:hypothetical protein